MVYGRRLAHYSNAACDIVNLIDRKKEVERSSTTAYRDKVEHAWQEEWTHFAELR